MSVSEGPTLKLGTPVERKLGPTEAHTYGITLEENMYIQLVVEQRGIDLVAHVISPEGSKLGDFDSPNGTDGPEHVSFVAAAPGVYRVVLAPLNPQDTKSGMYEIKIVELRQATEQEIKTSKNLEVVKTKGVALLNDVDGIMPEIRSPLTRIRAQLQAAQLLWPVDEKRASKYLTDAANGVKEFLTVEPTSNEYIRNYAHMMQLRSEIVGVLTQRDPEGALEFLRSSRMPLDPYGNEREYANQETALELNIAAQISGNDPKRALQIARQSLKNGYSSNLTHTIFQLKNKSPELAAELANEVVAKLLGDALLKSGYGAFLAGNLARGCRTSPGDVPTSGPDGSAALQLLSPETCRELLQKSYREALSYTPQPPHQYSQEREAARQLLYALRNVGPELDTLITGGSATVTKRISEIDSTGETPAAYVQVQQKMNEGGPMDGALELIEKVPAEMKDSLYSQYASNTAVRGDAARARQIINEKISNPFQRRQALVNVDIQEVYLLMQRGKVEDALRTINA
ncbi:MAG TPA: PPC domain-containing protein, partial [Pyrinomonadaceae bacterium]